VAQLQGHEAAQIECARLISELQGGGYLEPSKITLAQFLDRWLGHIKSQVSPRSHERYAEIVHTHIIPALGAVPLAKLRADQVSEFYTKALASGRKDGKGGLSPRSVSPHPSDSKAGACPSCSLANARPQSS